MTTKKIVGVSYDIDSAAAPVVMLKGSGPEADAALEQARKLGTIPIVKDPELVRELYRVPMDSPISRELFPVMAALLAHVIQIDRTRGEAS